jgi:hypothetical protein
MQQYQRVLQRCQEESNHIVIFSIFSYVPDYILSKLISPARMSLKEIDPRCFFSMPEPPWAQAAIGKIHSTMNCYKLIGDTYSVLKSG